MLLILLRFSLFLLSLYGGRCFFLNQLKIHKAFALLAFNCSLILSLYIAAFVGYLEPVADIIFVLSTLYGFYHLILLLRHRKFNINDYFWPSLWMLFYIFILGTNLWQTNLEHYDNFSHWAIIVKYLFTQGHLPTIQDSIISYTSYPMGSSLFVYYAVRVAGFYDNVMLLGQFSLIVSGLYGMFAMIRDRSRIMLVNLMMAAIALMNYFNISIRMNNLLVDFILPVLALAGIAIVYSQRHDLRRMSFLVFLTTSVLCLVKTSGLMFAVLVWIYYLITLTQVHSLVKNKAKLILLALGTLFLSLSPILIWNNYVKATFPVTKHEVSLISYQSIFNAKDSSVIIGILKKMWAYFFNLANISSQGLLVFNLVLLVAYLIIRFKIKRPNSLWKLLILGNATYIIYYFGILIMFLFSMPTEEAIQLAGIERYTSSMIIFILGLAFYGLVREIDYSFKEQNLAKRNYRSFSSIYSKQIYQMSAIMLAFFVVLMLLSETNGMKYHNQNFHNSISAQFMEASGHEFQLNDDRVLVVSTDIDRVNSYYTGFVGSYYLYSANLIAREAFLMDLDEFAEYVFSFDKLVILEDHITFNTMMEQLVGHSYPVGTYDVSIIKAKVQ